MNCEYVARENMGRADAAKIGANMSGLDRPKNVVGFDWLMYSSLGIGLVYPAAISGDLDARARGRGFRPARGALPVVPQKLERSVQAQSGFTPESEQ
jgi:hypothetical protein